MNTTYLLIGGNLGNRVKNLNTATNYVKEIIGEVISTSSIYETASWGIEDQPFFLNQILKVITNLSAQNIINKILFTEKKMGRLRLKKNASRIIDLDIIFFNDEIIDQPNLIIPHPEIQNRKFVLVPLAEIAPDFIHPILNKSVSALLSSCKDDLEVKLFTYPGSL